MRFAFWRSLAVDEGRQVTQGDEQAEVLELGAFGVVAEDEVAEGQAGVRAHLVTRTYRLTPVRRDYRLNAI